MYTDKSSNERKRKSENRRSSILKKQDTCRFENTEGISDGPRTPRRVSFASTYTIKHFNPIPWHNSVSDESSSSSGTNHETFTSALESSETFQKINTTASANQDTCHQLEENGFQSLDVRLTDCLKESDHQPHINCTIVFSDKDETGCMMETTANISQLSTSLDEPDIDSVFFLKDVQETAESTNISEAKKPKILDNLFALIKKGQSVDETECMMETTANISQLSTLLEEPALDSVFVVEDMQEVTQQTEATKPKILDNLFALIKKDESVDEAEYMMEMTAFVKDVQETNAETTNISEAKKTKILDNLFTLIKKDESVDKTECNMEMTANISQLSTSLEDHAMDSVFVKDIQETPQETTHSSEPVKPRILDNLFTLIKKDQPNEDVSSTVIPAQNRISGMPLSTISKFDMTPIEELSLASTNHSLSEPRKGLSVIPISTQALQLSQIGLKLDKVVGRLSVTKENSIHACEKENYPVLSTLNMSLRTREMEIYIKPKESNELEDMQLTTDLVNTIKIGIDRNDEFKNEGFYVKKVDFQEAPAKTIIFGSTELGEMELTDEFNTKTISLSDSIPEPTLRKVEDMQLSLSDSIPEPSFQKTEEMHLSVSNLTNVSPYTFKEEMNCDSTNKVTENLHINNSPSLHNVSKKHSINAISESSIIKRSSDTSFQSPEHKKIKYSHGDESNVNLQSKDLTSDHQTELPTHDHCSLNFAGELCNEDSNKSLPLLSNKLSVDLGVQSIGKLLEGQLINEDRNTSSVLSINNDSKVAVSKMANETVSNVELQIQNISNIAQHASRVTCSEKETMRKSVLKDLSHQLSLTQPLNLGRRKSTNFNLILGNKKKQLAPVTTTISLQSSNCESPKSLDNITTNLNFISPERPFQRSNFDEGMSPLPDIFGQTPTITMGEAKSKIREPIEDYDDLELLGNQEMPELANSADHSFTENSQSLYKLPTSNLNQQHNFEKFKSATSVSDLLVSLGIQHSRNVSNKVLSFVTIPLSSVQDQLKTLLTFVPKAEVLRHYLANIESSKELCHQESKLKLAECVEEPAAYTYFSTNDPINKKELLEMIEASKMLARSKWKKMKANHLLKYYTDREAIHEAFNVEVRDVLSATESILAVTSDIDKRLNEIDFILQAHKETTELTSCEHENAELRLRCLELTNSVERLQAENDCSLRRSCDSLQRVHSISGLLQWMNRMTEWSLLKSTENELEFGFLWQTVVLHIDYSQSSRRIVQVSIRQHLSESSKPWAKLAVTYAVSSINCKQLLETYPNISQMNQLLQDVSTVMFLSRQLSTELKYAFLNHYVTIDKNSLTVVVSDRLTCQKISMTASLVPNSYPYRPLHWIITPLIGHTPLEAVHKAIESIPGGDQYFTQLLTAVQLCITSS